jgi:hypothetical protein
VTAYEMRIKAGLVARVVTEDQETKTQQTTTTAEDAVIVEARNLLKMFRTYREASEATGIQLTRVHRLAIGKEMKANEMLSIFKATGRSVAVGVSA